MGVDLDWALSALPLMRLTDDPRGILSDESQVYGRHLYPFVVDFRCLVDLAAFRRTRHEVMICSSLSCSNHPVYLIYPPT